MEKVLADENEKDVVLNPASSDVKALEHNLDEEVLYGWPSH